LKKNAADAAVGGGVCKLDNNWIRRQPNPVGVS
jgi:hypothetical protein